MKITLDAKLFDNPPPTARLLHVASFALEGRHRMAVSDEKYGRYAVWRSGLPEHLADEWQLALDTSTQLEALEPAHRELWVIPGAASDWNNSPPTVGLDEALTAMALPYRLFVENGANDKAFLKAVASPEQLEAINKAVQNGCLEFANGGGITTLLVMLREVVADGKLAVQRTGALVDSDALQPGAPSAQSIAVANFCTHHGMWCHQLQRRCIENYIVLHTLWGWAYGGKRDEVRRDTFRAYQSMTTTQRHHYNMKGGFAADVNHATGSGALFSSLPPETRASLTTGFSPSIASLYAGPNTIAEKHLRAEGVWGEMNPMINRLLAMVR